MKYCFSIVLMLGLLLEGFTQPYSGTIFIDPDIITSSDPSTLTSVTYTGQGSRVVFDRRTNGWETINAFLFDVVWNDGLTSEAQVNPEFGDSAAAQVEAEKYALEIGRLPTCLREDVNEIWIHQGIQPFGGGNFSILIHTGQAASYEQSGILEETLVHEACHTSLDAAHASHTDWLAAQNADPNFISTYARDNPTREDIAESFLTWIAVRHRSDRITQAMNDTITSNIPNRLIYFDQQNFDLYPLYGTTNIKETNQLDFLSAYPNPTTGNVRFNLEKEETVQIKVMSLEGKVVDHFTQTTQQLNFELEGVPGIYFIEVSTAEGIVHRQKIIKQ